MAKLTDGELLTQVNRGSNTSFTLAQIRAARAKIDEVAILKQQQLRFTARAYQDGDLGVTTLADITATNSELKKVLAAGGKIYVILDHGQATVLQWHHPNRAGHHPILGTELLNIASNHRQEKEDEEVNNETIKQVIRNL